MKKFYQTNKNSTWFWAFFVLVFGLFFALPIMSLDAGNSGDEDGFQIPQGNYVLEWYKTFGEDSTNLTFSNLKYYGSSFDVVMAFVNQTFQISDVHTSRHIANALFGWLCLVFVGLIAYRIAGWRAGVMALILLFLSPRFLGHAFNNPKDIPFAASIVMAVFFMLQFFRQFPKVKKTTVVFLTLSIALSISVRIGGLILFGFFGLFGLLFFMQEVFQYRKEQRKITLKRAVEFKFKTVFKRLFFYGIGICAGGYFLGLILWPYALQAPIKHPMEAFTEMAKFAVSLRQNFEGSLVWSDLLPWYYTPKYIFITIPLAVLIGLLLYLFAGALKKENRFTTFVVYFACVFPIFWLVYSHANVYGGWRHSLFAYPFMTIAAGLGFNALVDVVKQKYLKIAFLLLPVILLIPEAFFIAKNHPYEYTYFNTLAGGVNGAYGNYELDYYYHSTREASEWVIENAEKSGLETTGKIKVATWHQASVGYFFRNDTARFEVVFSRWHERGNNDWDYAIFTITGMSPDMLKHSEAFPPTNTVHEIKVDGIPIAIVLKRTDKSDYFGNLLKRENKPDSAIVLLKKALTIVPSDESVLLNMGEIYLNKRQTDSAIFYLDKLLNFDPKNENANYYKAYALMFENQLNEALQCLQTIVKHNSKNDAAPWMAAQICAQQGNLMLMEKMIENTLIANTNKQQDALNLMHQIYPQLGLSANDATMSFTKIWIRVLEKLGYEEEANQLKNQR